MQINDLSSQQTTFGKLLSGETLKKTLSPDKQVLINKYNVIKVYIRKEKLHRMNHVDIILNYSNNDGFYGVIADKNKKIPMKSEDYFCKVNTATNALERFKEWVKYWENRLS